MAYPLVCRRAFAMAGLGLITLATAALADPPTSPMPQLKVDWTFKVDVHLQHPYLQNLAPWWTYFPNDPHLMTPGPRASHYPTWPQPFPPTTDKDGAPMSMPPAQRPPGPVVHRRVLTYPTWVQPVGHVSYQAPSYWYAR